MKLLTLLVTIHLIPLQVFGAPRNFAEVVGWVSNFASLLIPAIVALTFVYILWNITTHWIIQGGSEEGVQTGKWALITGVIGLTVMVGMWGLVSLIRNAIFF
jgi:hypothetical protein